MLLDVQVSHSAVEFGIIAVLFIYSNLFMQYTIIITRMMMIIIVIIGNNKSIVKTVESCRKHKRLLPDQQPQTTDPQSECATLRHANT